MVGGQQQRRTRTRSKSEGNGRRRLVELLGLIFRMSCGLTAKVFCNLRSAKKSASDHYAVSSGIGKFGDIKIMIYFCLFLFLVMRKSDRRELEDAGVMLRE